MSEFLILNYITKSELEKIREEFNRDKHLKIKNINKNEKLIVEDDENRIEIKEKTTTDKEQNKYRIKNKGIETIIYVSNQYIYNYYKENGEYPNDLICIRCKSKIKILWGIAIKKTVTNNKTIYHIHGVYHSNKCAYDDYKRFYQNDIIFSESDKLMREINFRFFGTYEIGEAKNINLLESNYGPLTQDEFDNDDIIIEDMQDIEFLPIRRKYQLVSD